jgi:threonine synthase
VDAPDDDVNPFVAYRRRMAWHAFATANGMTDAATVALVRELDAAVASVDGRGFVVTPFGRADGLSSALALDVWVKDETGNVSGSHKGRHLMSVLLHLLAAERVGGADGASRRPLAIASCGNAALAAATLAAAVDWPIDVFVPPDADPWVARRLVDLGARVVPCPRGSGDPPGDPCVRRFRNAVDAGAVAFSVQGPENALCLDGGRTIAWEMAAQLEGGSLGDVFVQVGGGALATAVGDGLRDEGVAPPARVHAVQTQGCAPLARAWECVQRIGIAGAPSHWDDCMRPWESVPTSAATGILDDETYDWLGVVDVLASTGGDAIVAPEADVLAANDLVARTTSISADHTATAGLAGVRAFRRQLGDGARVVVLFTGAKRPVDPNDSLPP